MTVSQLTAAFSSLPEEDVAALFAVPDDEEEPRLPRSVQPAISEPIPDEAEIPAPKPRRMRWFPQIAAIAAALCVALPAGWLLLHGLTQDDFHAPESSVLITELTVTEATTTQTDPSVSRTTPPIQTDSTATTAEAPFAEASRSEPDTGALQTTTQPTILTTTGTVSTTTQPVETTTTSETTLPQAVPAAMQFALPYEEMWPGDTVRIRLRHPGSGVRFTAEDSDLLSVGEPEYADGDCFVTVRALHAAQQITTLFAENDAGETDAIRILLHVMSEYEDESGRGKKLILAFDHAPAELVTAHVGETVEVWYSFDKCAYGIDYYIADDGGNCYTVENDAEQQCLRVTGLSPGRGHFDISLALRYETMAVPDCILSVKVIP